jgi:hypothetical protein
MATQQGLDRPADFLVITQAQHFFMFLYLFFQLL